MKNIFRFLSKSRAAVAAIVALLIVQAYCDLALPAYTSDLLNVGLQQNGIEDAVPETIREESLDTIELFLSESETETLETAYLPADGEGVRKLKDIGDAERETLHGILLLPESVIFQMESSEEGAAGLAQIQGAIALGVMTKEDFRQQMREVLSQMEGLTDTFLAQVAVSYVSAEYEAQGVDLNRIRNAYLFKVGAKMLAMALVMR
ncbi:MAG: hypothetical protein NC541_02075 [bacterium]|nr:hypothetical protein [bacterium]